MTEQDFSASLRRKIIWALLLLLVSLGAMLVALQIGVERGQNTALARQNDNNDNERGSNESKRESERQKGDPNDPNDRRPLHEHPAFDERVAERNRMVRWTPTDRCP